MTMETENNLSRQKIQQLITAIGSNSKEDTTKLEVTVYDWHHPRYFNNDELEKLSELTDKISNAITEKFTQLYNTDFHAKITSTTFHFAAELSEQILKNAQSDYHLAFGTNQEHPCGSVAIPVETAVILVKLLLGETETEKDSGKTLSQLEESLLWDIASTIVEALSTCLHGHYNFLPTRALIKGQLPIEFQAIEEICKITFITNKDNSNNNTAGQSPAPDETRLRRAHIFIPCNMLAKVIGKSIKDNNELSAEETSKAILAHLQQMPVLITTQLGHTSVTFDEIMRLRSGDILLLDKPIEEPIELLIEGKTIFHAQPAKSEGQQAVIITESTKSYDKKSTFTAT